MADSKEVSGHPPLRVLDRNPSGSASDPLHDTDWDVVAEKRLVRKIDLLLMPLLTFSYGLQFVSLPLPNSLAVLTAP